MLCEIKLLIYAELSMSLKRLIHLALVPLFTVGITNFCCAELTRERSSSQSTHVKFFDAISNQQIKVRFIPIDSTRGNVLIENLIEKTVHVELPSAFAAVPVLAQFGFDQPGGQQQPGQQQGGQSNQAVGGGMNQGQQFGGGQQNGIQGGGFMRIAPGKKRKVKATTVCLQHGRPDPNPKVAYRIMPIRQYTSDDDLIALCGQVGEKSVSQKVAQAAAWHLANNMQWPDLAKLNRLESRYLGNYRFFSPQELSKAKDWIEARNKSQESTSTNTIAQR